MQTQTPQVHPASPFTPSSATVKHLQGLQKSLCKFIGAVCGNETFILDSTPFLIQIFKLFHITFVHLEMVTTRSTQSHARGEETIPQVTSTTMPALFSSAAGTGPLVTSTTMPTMFSTVVGMASALAGMQPPQGGPSRARNVQPNQGNHSMPTSPRNQPSRGELWDFICRQGELLE
ncbi:aspartate kinase [Sesbania bispinosa]|nr:aspartate kinase [Sesbania bispinosa]